MEKLLILRLGSMGDVLHALPAVAALRRALPSATVGWAVEQRWSELLCAAGAENAASGSPEKPLVDRLHFINTVAWRKGLLSSVMWNEAWIAMSSLRAARYDVAVDFQGAWKSAGLAVWSGAPQRFGFDHPRERPAALFYTRRVQTNSAHVVDQNLELAAAVASQNLQPAGSPLPCSARTESWADGELQQRGLRQFAVLSPGGGWERKAVAAIELWPSRGCAGARRIAVARQLRSRRRRVGPRGEARERRLCPAAPLLAGRTHRSHAARQPLHWR